MTGRTTLARVRPSASRATWMRPVKALMSAYAWCVVSELWSSGENGHERSRSLPSMTTST